MSRLACSTKNEKDIFGAFQEWRQDQAWLVKVGYVHSHGLLRVDDGRMAQTILVKMMPSEGRNAMQRHLLEQPSKIKNYYDLEEELDAELYRREVPSCIAGKSTATSPEAPTSLKGRKRRTKIWAA